MESLFHFVAAPSRCGYLPSQQWSLEYEFVGRMSPDEYLRRMAEGWRRFGTMLFRPACRACNACRSLRVLAGQFRPDRSQRRCRQANEGVVRLEVGVPGVNRTKLALYDRYHTHQARHKGWPEHAPKDSHGYVESFVHHPFPVEEWCYYVGDRLVGVGYVDALPGPPPPPGGRGEGGLSAIYFFYEPAQRDRALGTWNVLCLIAEAARRGLPYAYLGYWVQGCGSMEYKTRFVPNEVRGPDGVWRPLRTLTPPGPPTAGMNPAARPDKPGASG
jgi:arginine-tRNA-protein transferase